MFRSCPWLHMNLEASLGYMTLPPPAKKKNLIEFVQYDTTQL